MRVPSFAKINWTLEILGRRSDQYHELRTILQTIAIYDELTFSLLDRDVRLVCDNAELPCDQTNLVYRAALLLKNFTGCSNGVKIELQKKIPMGAGLGGGSSNAAITLLALMQLWNLSIEPADLLRLGAQLGADVPFFFFGGTGIGIGRGDEVYPMADIEAAHLLLVNPGINIPTREIYGNLPSELTSEPSLNKMPFSLGAAYASVKRSPLKLRNDLEVPAITLYPVIAEVKQFLKNLQATAVLMSGSGSTVFAVFESDAACAQAQSELKNNTDWWCAATRTLNRSEYQSALQHL